MNVAEINKEWFELAIKLKQNFATLTDEDLKCEEGKIEETLEKIQIKLGKTKVELATIFGDM